MVINVGKIKNFIRENIFLTISLTLLFITLIVIAVVYIPDWNNDEKYEDNSSSKINSELESNMELNEVGQSANYIKVRDTNCPQFSGVMYATGDKFVTELDGKYYLYEYVLDKKFSDETNCRLVEELDKKPKLFTYDSLFWGDDRSALHSTTYIVYEDLTYAQINNPNDYNMKKVYSSYVEEGIVQEDGSYIIKKPSYEIEIIKWKDKTNTFKIKNEFLDTKQYGYEWEVSKCAVTYKSDISFNIFLELTIDEPILKYLDGAVLTHSGIYTWGLLDDSCLTYADVDCKSGFVMNLDLKDRYDDILFVNKQYIVFKDGTTYMYQN